MRTSQISTVPARAQSAVAELNMFIEERRRTREPASDLEVLERELRERFRDVKQGPDGFVYVVTDDPRGRVLRIRPIAP